MRRTILLLAILALVLASCGGDAEESERTQGMSPGATASASAATGSPSASPIPKLRTDFDIPPFSDLVKMYDYDTSEPLGYKVIGSERQKGATVYDIEYQSSGFAVPGYLVIPDGQGPFPVVLHAHGVGAGPSYFLPDAVALAREGDASLLITSPANRPPYKSGPNPGHAQRDIDAYVQYVIDLRRGLDLLETLPEIDAGRIGFVSQSWGALVGGILAGVDDRIDAYVLTSAGGYYTDVLLKGGENPSSAYLDTVAVLNAVNYVGHNQGAAFLFQDSEADTAMSSENVQAYFEAAPQPKALRWHEGGHELGCTNYSGCDPHLPAFAFHRVWLQENV